MRRRPTGSAAHWSAHTAMIGVEIVKGVFKGACEEKANDVTGPRHKLHWHSTANAHSIGPTHLRSSPP